MKTKIVEIEEVNKRFEAEALAKSLEIIAGTYGSDEWRCASEASNWSSPIFDKWHINYAI
jgi:hypothetical protein